MSAGLKQVKVHYVLGFPLFSFRWGYGIMNMREALGVSVGRIGMDAILRK